MGEKHNDQAAEIKIHGRKAATVHPWGIFVHEGFQIEIETGDLGTFVRVRETESTREINAKLRAKIFEIGEERSRRQTDLIEFHTSGPSRAQAKAERIESVIEDWKRGLPEIRPIARTDHENNIIEVFHTHYPGLRPGYLKR